MSETIKRSWLEDSEGNKIAPRTFASQITTDDGVLLEKKIEDDLSEVKSYVDEEIAAESAAREAETASIKNDVKTLQEAVINGGTGEPVTVTKELLGLGNVDNTSDLDKPVSTATQEELDKKANQSDLTSHINNKENPHAITKEQIGLSNVDNTSDMDKPVSTATQTALDKKADSSDLTSHTGNKSNPHGVTKAQVGLGNVDNTSDANKPVSTAQKTAIDTAYSNAKTYTDEKIAELINGAPTTLDTLGEIATAMSDNADVVEALDEAIGTKANQSDLTAHTGNTTNHITSTERTNWNAAKTHADSAHAPSNAEANQNAFSNIKVGSTTVAADSKTDTLILAGSNVTLTPDSTNDKVTIGITDENVISALGYTPVNQQQPLVITDNGGVDKNIIQLLNPTPDSPTTVGSEVVFGAGGNIFIGSGEGLSQLRNAVSSDDTKLEGEVYTAGGERMYLSSDASIMLYSGTNTIANRKGLVFSNTGHLYPLISGQTSDLGTSDQPWRNVYASGAFIGNLTGDASNALKLGGKSLLASNAQDTWDGIPYIDTKGVMEIGKYIDFHATDGNTDDYNARITAETTGLTLSGTTKGTFQGNLSGNATGLSCTNVTTTNTDLNDYKTSGVFYFSSTYAPVNIPGGVNGFLLVFANGSQVKQIWLRHGTNNSNDHHTWIRFYNGGAWSDWRRFLMSGESLTAAKLTSTLVEDKSSETWVVPLTTTGVSTGDKKSYIIKGYTVGVSNGVKNADETISRGRATLALGNNTAAGTEGNQFGNLRLYSTGTGYVNFAYGGDEGTSSNTTIWLPAKSGTVALDTVATTSANGLMSKEDKIRIDDIEEDVATKSELELYSKTAIFFGDSITWGEKADEDGVQVPNPYPTVFGNITGVNVINCGVRGATASTAQTNNFAAQITANTDNINNADVCFVNFGVNDFSKEIPVGNELTTHSFYSDYLAGIESILAINSKIEIVVILPPRGKGYTVNDSWRNDNGDILDSYINAIIEIATSKNLRIVDFGNVGISEDNAAIYYPNGHNHLTQDGYTLLGNHLAKVYKTGTYFDRETFYNQNYRVATNQLELMVFPNPLDIKDNSHMDGVYWALSGSDTAGITSCKNVQIINNEHYHFEFMAYHREKANDRLVNYTVTFTNVDNTSIKYVFKKTIKCVYERLHFNFYASNATGKYSVNIVAEGDDVYISSPSLSYGGIIPNARKRKVGKVDISSSNKMTVHRNKYVNGEFIFNMEVTADVSTTNLVRVNLNTIGIEDAYLPTETQYFVGIDLTSKTTVPMSWTHDSNNAGTYLLKVLSGIESGHVYVANGILYMGRNDAVHEIIAQEY